jgi:UDP-N-acetyl-D-mannosaminuronic acid dehydrogenase
MVEKIDKIAIFGLGHIGLPTAALFAKNGFNVVGVDINQKTVDKVNSGVSSIMEPGMDELVKEVVSNGNLSATTQSSEATKNSNVLIVIVPTPVDENKCSDLSAVISACHMIADDLKKGDLVIIESTIPPGTCEDVVIPILEKNGLKSVIDFKVAYTPERALPNNTLFEMTHNARVIGGIDSESSKRAVLLYEKITEGKVIAVKNLVTAEMVKLMENTFRDTNIALANELAMACESMGIDAIDAITAANYHPRVNIHTPGPGVGGHCLSIDPYFIVEIADKKNNPAVLIKTARDINEHMPYHVAEIIKKTLAEFNKPLNKSTIGILGVAYKANVADARETPAEPLIRALCVDGCEVMAHDPHVSREIIENMGASFVEFEKALKCDCVVLITDHEEYYNITPEMIENSIFICNRPILDPEEFRKQGVIFRGVGRL